jgi:hypothetical protein
MDRAPFLLLRDDGSFACGSDSREEAAARDRALVENARGRSTALAVDG